MATAWRPFGGTWTLNVRLRSASRAGTARRDREAAESTREMLARVRSRGLIPSGGERQLLRDGAIATRAELSPGTGIKTVGAGVNDLSRLGEQAIIDGNGVASDLAISAGCGRGLA